ncbi:MAG: guanylate kinase [Sandaracinaceae bacterium]|nr:guanylate kinase [Sandaracinaceae bacterium]
MFFVELRYDQKMKSDFLFLIVASPSGAGKTTLIHLLLERRNDLGFSVSHTTRKPRPGERDGVHYHFIEAQAFEQMIERGAFIEWAWVHGHMYGTSHSEIARAKEQGKRGIVFDVDVQGARRIKALYPEAIAVFILPPSWEELKRRLLNRGTESPQSLEIRLERSREEILHYAFFDYVIVNDKVEQAARALSSIVLAEEHRTKRLALMAEGLIESMKIERNGK